MEEEKTFVQQDYSESQLSKRKAPCPVDDIEINPEDSGSNISKEKKGRKKMIYGEILKKQKKVGSA